MQASPGPRTHPAKPSIHPPGLNGSLPSKGSASMRPWCCDTIQPLPQQWDDNGGTDQEPVGTVRPRRCWQSSSLVWVHDAGSQELKTMTMTMKGPKTGIDILGFRVSETLSQSGNPETPHHYATPNSAQFFSTRGNALHTKAKGVLLERLEKSATLIYNSTASNSMTMSRRPIFMLDGSIFRIICSGPPICATINCLSKAQARVIIPRAHALQLLYAAHPQGCRKVDACHPLIPRVGPQVYSSAPG